MSYYGGQQPPPPQYGAPPSSYGGPPSGPPMQPPPPSQGHFPPPDASGAGTGGYMPPPPPQLGGGGAVGGGMPSAPKSVQFFSLAGGTPQPIAASATSMGPPVQAPPPSSQMGGGGMGMGMGMGGGMGGPPMGGGGGPPAAGAQFYSTGGGGAPGSQMAPPPPPAPEYAGQQYGAPPPQSMVGMPSAFDSGSNLYQQQHIQQQPMSMQGGAAYPGGALGPPSGMGGAPGMIQHPQQGHQQQQHPSALQQIQGQDPSLGLQGGGGGAPLPTLAEMDLSIQCNPAFLRSSVVQIVNSQALASNARIPLGIVCRPMVGDVGVGNDQVEVVDFGSTGIVRCKRCRTYINPYASWTDNGRRWRCNICAMVNDVPASYFSHLDANGRRRDRDQRPELSRCSVEFVAPADYMVRPPQPPVYFFVIDVSAPSTASGMLRSCVNAIKASLDDLPGKPRTQIGFITFDTSIHFYNLKSTLKAPQMLVVSDISDVILPSPEDLLVNLEESRRVVDALLDSIPDMFANSTAIQTCTGPALMAAKRVITHVGGKLCLFQSSLPSLGEGTLKQRENTRLVGTDKEHSLLNAEDVWYKNNAIDFSRLQVAVDTFLFSGQYTDLATIAVLSKYTAGSTYYYPGFHAPRDSTRFEKELTHCLTRPTGFEAVMRVRATRGLRIANFYGNYYIRGTDLLALPNCSSDSTFALDLAYDEPILNATAVTVQAALLYTSSAGERRIRVHTMVIPVTPSVPEMLTGLDIDTAVNIMAKQAVDIATKTGMDNARTRVNQNTVEILRGARGGGGGMMGGAAYGQYPQQAMPAASQELPGTLALLPLYSMSLQKSLVLRGGNDVRLDERAFYHQLLLNMDVEESKVFIYPRLFCIHLMTSDAGRVLEASEEDTRPTAGPFKTILPEILNLSHERLSSDGIFLMENGCDLFMWIGRSVNPSILSALFGVQSLEGVDISSLAILAENNDFSFRVNAVIVALRAERSSRYMHLHFIREGDGYAEAYFARYLIEDRATFPGGTFTYTEYHSSVTR